MLKNIKKYLLVVVTGSVIFGCGAHVTVDLGKDTSIVTLEKNINKG